jgi:hypothetical protein
MRTFAFGALILSLLTLAVMAGVFQVQRARSLLRLLRDAALLYALALLAFGVYLILDRDVF